MTACVTVMRDDGLKGNGLKGRASIHFSRPYAGVVVAPDAARDLARALLAEAMPARWNHVRGVADAAEDIGLLPGIDPDLLIAAALLHDVGYADDLAATGFHPLDGARYLRATGVDERLCSLVAHHSGARIEAELRGMREVLLGEFIDEHSATRDALWYCDMTTGPDGQRMTLDQRLAEIEGR